MVFSEIKEGNKYKLFINGKWDFSLNNEFIDVKNPYDGKIVNKVSSATKKDSELALSSAFNAKESMKSLPAGQRSAILMKTAELMEKYHDEIMNTIIKESGKPIQYAKSEIHATIERIKYAAEEAKDIEGRTILDDAFSKSKGKIAVVVKQPAGVVLAIGPFNYPLFTGASKVAEALAAGNSVILKPASDDPTCLLLFTALLEKAGIPKGAVNTITGRGSEIGDFLINDSRVNLISFTGSSSVGKRLACICGMKKLILELGGKCPALVLDDADLENAAKECVSGSFKLSGQRCDALSRIIIVDKIADKFLTLVKKELKGWKSGNPFDENVKIGPLINENAMTKVKELVDDAVKKGAKRVFSGKGAGLFYPVTVLDNVTENMRIAWEETLGPVMTIIRVKE